MPFTPKTNRNREINRDFIFRQNQTALRTPNCRTHEDTEQRQQIEVQQQMFNMKKGGRGGGGMKGRGPRNPGPGQKGLKAGREGGGPPRGSQAKDEGRNTEPTSTKKTPIDPSCLSNTRKVRLHRPVIHIKQLSNRSYFI